MPRQLLSSANLLLTLTGALILAPGCSRKASDDRPPTLHIKGSDSLFETAKLWASVYRKAMVEVSGGGSAVGIAELIRGTVDIANSSRRMTEQERKRAVEMSGKEPHGVIVGYDAVAVYVHSDNPIEEISKQELQEIFGEGGKITHWSDLGVKIEKCRSDDIVVVSRNTFSGTHARFRNTILGPQGRYRSEAVQTLGSQDLVTLIGNVPCAIGYSAMSFRSEGIKIVPVKFGDGPAVMPSAESVRSETYPMARPLYLYTLGEPQGPIEAYLDWVLSPAGQKILENVGYVPIDEAAAASASE